MALTSGFRALLGWLAALVVVGLFAFIYVYNPSTAMSAATPPPTSPPPVPPKKGPPPANLETAVFGTGCFWCSQAVFERLDGVWEATCGYMGGTVANPTYEQVCTELTGHAEVTQVKFDPKVVSYEQLLEWFWHMHDPTTLNRQGADTGTSYRSVIFYFSDAQKAAAEKSKAAAQKNFKDPIVTEITKAATFYKAEDYHQEYFNNNSSQGYCQIIIAPKLDKLKLPETPTTAGNGTAK
jgi:peptide-methionine (S)-S-oxide reductase